jgi:hypothetical protein
MKLSRSLIGVDKVLYQEEILFLNSHLLAGHQFFLKVQEAE